jgi:hypothetical protein
MAAHQHTEKLTVITVWLSVGLTCVDAFLRFGRASWFVLNAARSTADPNGSVPSEPKPSA